MKQILQDLRNGTTSVEDVPSPKNKPGHALIRSEYSLVPSGTERSLVKFGQSSYLNKARQEPEKVKQVLAKVKNDGIFETIEAVNSKLDQPMPLGYCNSGVVLETGIKGFSVGDRVVSNGSHSEVVRVPKNLCAKIPDNVDGKSAAFTVLGSIGLQGIRLLKPTLGETIVVSGLGLVGLMAAQMLKANGCRVLGLDFDSKRCEIANNLGIETLDLSRDNDPIASAIEFSKNEGVDGVIIAASSTSNEVIHQAAEMCRKRGRIVLIGVVGLNLVREDFYKKEISFQVSASYGPGRYDSSYEEEGNDYPIGFVRWTEQRNFEAVLEMMSSGSLDVKPLISDTFSIGEAEKAYDALNDSSSLGILVKYSTQDEQILKQTSIELNDISGKLDSSEVNVGFLGAGNYSSRILIPAFKKAGVRLHSLVSDGGITAFYHGKKNSFNNSSSDDESVIQNPDINTVVIATRHNNHASQVRKALVAGKNVFVEKPLAINLLEMDEIEKVYEKINLNKGKSPILMIGFNRRFSPHIQRMKTLLQEKEEPKSITMTISSGKIPADHWTQNLKVGGGRIIGEACHFIDLMYFLIESPIQDFHVNTLGKKGTQTLEDKVSISIKFADGSIGLINYFSNGGIIFPKERIEVFCDNAVLQLNNFRKLKGYGWKGFKNMRTFRQDKGQEACAKAFVEAVKSGDRSPIPYSEIIYSSRKTIEIAESIR